MAKKFTPYQMAFFARVEREFGAEVASDMRFKVDAGYRMIDLKRELFGGIK